MRKAGGYRRRSKGQSRPVRRRVRERSAGLDKDLTRRAKQWRAANGLVVNEKISAALATDTLPAVTAGVVSVGGAAGAAPAGGAPASDVMDLRTPKKLALSGRPELMGLPESPFSLQRQQSLGFSETYPSEPETPIAAMRQLNMRDEPSTPALRFSLDAAVSWVLERLFPEAYEEAAMAESDSEDDMWGANPFSATADLEPVRAFLKSEFIAAGLQALQDDPQAPTTFWTTFEQRLCPKWVARVCYDDPAVPSAQARLLSAAFIHLVDTRTLLCKALAETTFDYLERFLIELKANPTFDFSSPFPPHPPSSSTSLAPSMPLGDGRVLAELMQTFIKAVCEAHAETTADTHPLETADLTQQVELLSMSLMNLCRARPVLESDFELLTTCFCRLVPTRPHISVTLLRRLVSAWPTIDSSREVKWLQLAQTALLCSPAPTICGAGLHKTLFRQVVKSLGSLHAAVAKQALELCSNMYIMLHYILPFRDISSAVSRTLVANRTHWNALVVQMSDQQFEHMLDMS